MESSSNEKVSPTVDYRRIMFPLQYNDKLKSYEKEQPSFRAAERVKLDDNKPVLEKLNDNEYFFSS
jgi:hypothetical protein